MGIVKQQSAAWGGHVASSYHALKYLSSAKDSGQYTHRLGRAQKAHAAALKRTAHHINPHNGHKITMH